jgi:hypothetical protein
MDVFARRTDMKMTMIVDFAAMSAQAAQKTCRIAPDVDILES